MRKENGHSGARVILTAIVLRESISTAAVISMLPAGTIRHHCRKLFKNLKKLYKKIVLYYNKNQTMKLAKAVLGVCTAGILLTGCKDTVNFRKTKSGVPYKIFPAGKSKDTIGVGNIIKFNITLRIKGNGKVKDTVLNTT